MPFGGLISCATANFWNSAIGAEPPPDLGIPYSEVIHSKYQKRTLAYRGGDEFVNVVFDVCRNLLIVQYNWSVLDQTVPLQAAVTMSTARLLAPNDFTAMVVKPAFAVTF